MTHHVTAVDSTADVRPSSAGLGGTPRHPPKAHRCSPRGRRRPNSNRRLALEDKEAHSSPASSGGGGRICSPPPWSCGPRTGAARTPVRFWNPAAQPPTLTRAISNAPSAHRPGPPGRAALAETQTAHAPCPLPPADSILRAHGDHRGVSRRRPWGRGPSVPPFRSFPLLRVPTPISQCASRDSDPSERWGWAAMSGQGICGKRHRAAMPAARRWAMAVRRPLRGASRSRRGMPVPPVPPPAPKEPLCGRAQSQPSRS